MRLNELLQKSSHKFNLDIGYFVKNTIISNISYVFTILVGLFINIILARTLSQTDFGYYKQFFLIMSLLSMFMLSGISYNLVIALINKKYGAFFTAFKAKIVSFFFAIITLLGYGFYMYNNNHYFYIIIIFTGTIYLLNDIFLIYKNIFIANKNFIKLSKIDSLLEAIKLIAITAVFLFSKDYGNFLIATIVPVVFINIYFFIKKLKYIRKQEQTKDKEFLLSTFKASFFDGGLNIIGQMDRIITLALYDPAIFAIYSVSNSIADAFKAIFKNFLTVAFPKIVENNDLEIKKRLNKVFFKMLYCLVLIALIIVPFIPYIITLCFSERYIDSIIPAQILLISASVGIMFMFINNFYFATRKYKLLYIDNAVFFVIKIILIFLLARFGLIGLASAVAISRIVSTFFSYFLFNLKS